MINTTKYHRFTMNANAWISPRHVTKSIGLCFCFLMMSGCIAQQADLARIQKDLEDQISKINQEKKALASEVAQAKDAINESKGLLAQQNTEMKDLFRARAEIKQQIKALRDSDLTNISGDIEQINFKMSQLQEDLESRNSQTGTRIEGLEAQLNTQLETLGTQLNKQSEDLAAQQTQTTALIQQVDQDGASINQKMEEFQTSLTTFKESMGELGNKFVQEAERDSRVEAELSQQVGQTTQLTKASTEDLQAHLDANKANIAEISQTLTALKEAVAQSSTLLGGRLDEHGGRLDQLGGRLSAHDGHVTQLLERTDLHQAKFQDVDTLTQAHATNIQELNQTALQLREHQDVMGSLLGKRGDNLIQQAGRLDERVNDLEAHQTTLDQTLETNRQNTGRHFQELTASISSMTQALQKTSGDFATRINTQDQLLNDLTQRVQELQVVKQNLDANSSQVQLASQGTTELRETVQQVTNRLHELENHQSGITGKFDADVQSINSHLTEVNGAIVSVKDALSQVNGQLSTRIDEQERHLNQALTSFQSVQGAGDMTQANMEHLNQLTETVNKLRDVVTTIGTKFGERVDQHETRLADLAKRINRLSASKKKKKK